MTQADPRKRPIQAEKRDQARSTASWFSSVRPIPFFLLRASGEVFMKACEHPGYMWTPPGTWPPETSCKSSVRFSCPIYAEYGILIILIVGALINREQQDL